ncbi:superoxide dismutase [Xylariaceae sp. FL0255]|nr:superoxide dismutase [Xylariaceae sp. FL0255]
MRFSVVLSIFAAGISSVLGQNASTTAQVVENNPAGASGVATLPNNAFWTAGSLTSNIKGSVSAVTAANGTGVDFQVSFSNLPKEGGPFLYHIHVDPVDAQGNCTNTLAHLDPYVRGEEPPCDASQPATCQVGDLSGKYGAITSDPYTATFHDDYTSTQEGMGTYFFNRSIVVHFANTTRITCASFVVSDAGCNTTTPSASSTTPLPTGTSSATPSATPPPTGGVGTLGVFEVLAVIPLAVMFLDL